MTIADGDDGDASTEWVCVHFALVVPTRVGDLLVPEGWSAGAYPGADHPYAGALQRNGIGGGGDPAEWFPGRLADATANRNSGNRSARAYKRLDAPGYTRGNVAVIALELLTFTCDSDAQANDFVIAHISVDRPDATQLMLISQNLRRPWVDPFGDVEERSYYDPMGIVVRAIEVELHAAVGIDLVAIGASGRVRFARPLQQQNPVNDRAPLSVSVSGVATRLPAVSALGVQYGDTAWSPQQLWAFALAYGLAPGMQWPGDTLSAAEEVTVDCPKDWTGVVTEIGQAFICVDPSPDDVRFRGFWNLGHTRFVDLLILGSRQTHLLELLSEDLVALGRDAFEKTRRIDDMTISGVSELRLEVERFGQRYAEFRNDNWFTIIPRRNRATVILQQIQRRLYAQQLLDDIDAELRRMSEIITVAADRRHEAHEQALRERVEARNALVQEESRARELERAKRDWLISVISALIGLPSITYALAAISTPSGAWNGALWSIVWMVLAVPTILFVHWLITRRGSGGR
ncbi:hypothetical protein [Gordonia sp. NPDC003585]|uniref:hypothetical protein n=1 Tax=Gordonia sp. NPDC003585 TaxID=3154275 RepID=UPI00339E60A7